MPTKEDFLLTFGGQIMHNNWREELVMVVVNTSCLDDSLGIQPQGR
jgi:hypothetical protein